MFRRGFLNNPARPTSQKPAPAPSGSTPTPTPAPAPPSASRSAPASDKPKVNSIPTQNRSTFIRSKYQQSKLDTEQISTWLARAAIENGYDFENEFESSPNDDQSPSFVPEDTDTAGIGRTRQQEKNSKRNAKKKAKRKQAAAATTDKQDEDGDSQHQATVADEEGEGADDDDKDPVGETESTADPKAPEPSKPTSQKTLPGGRYRITANQYIKLARFLVDRKVEIPLELLQLLRRCCSLRLATLRRFLPNPDLSTKTHAYFVNVLREVGSLLHEAREEALLESLKNATGAKGKNKNKSDNVRSANRFDSLADLVDELNDDLSDELPDIRLPEPPRPKNAPVIASNAHFSPVDTADECVESILAFFSDLHDVRDYIRELWLDYNEGRTDLLTASVTTNTALELLRRPHEDVMARIMPFFDNSLMTMFQLVVNYVRMRATGDPQIRLVVSFTDVSDDSPDLPFYDFFFVPCWQMVDALTRVITDNHVLLMSMKTAAHTAAETTDMPTDVAQLQDELKATRQQYQSLLSKLTQIRSTLGTRLKQDADELDRRQSQIASLTASQADIQSTVSTVQAELVDSHAEQDRLRFELDAQRQASASSSNSTDSVTRQAAESAARVSALSVSLTDLQAERKSVEEGYHTKCAQREQAQMELEMSRIAREVAERAAHKQRMRAEREAQSARQLQDVLEEYQQNGIGGGDGDFDSELGDHHVYTLGGGSSQREKIGQLAEELELYCERANTAESQLADYKNAAERCERLEREVKEKNLFVGKLRHEGLSLLFEY
ncbi:hypothetical protein A4X09_0g5306 [Tilletia walkeri]|uniref:DUF6604 domain-containing protein n=1 Tax=Tilletia walkeri TaxID=117179 RepID=A0A8X7N625_9BASI|nr:hypothetical protein A4X09_0g5306 [Tilletia walkeri]